MRPPGGSFISTNSVGDAVTTAERRRELLEQMITQQPGRLARKMRAAGHTTAEAEDLAQETMVRALRALKDVRGPAEEALMCGWVDRIAANLLLNVRRSLARHPHSDSLPDHEVQCEMRDRDGFEEAVEALSRRHAVE